MSRSHMLYEDKKINKVINVKWKDKWQEDSVFMFGQSPGFTVEGVVLGRIRIAVSDEGNNPVHQRYTGLQLRFKKAYKRMFSSTGEEIEPWQTGTKKINTGYLMSSYKTVATDNRAVTFEEISNAISVPQLNSFIPDHLKTSNSLLLFHNESSFTDIEVNTEDYLRVKTKGNGPYIESVSKLDEGHVSTSRHEIGSAGSSQGSWTDKIMSMKGNKVDNDDQTDGVDESEWDD